MSNSRVLVSTITYRLYAKWNESGSQNKVSCVKQGSEINNFYLKQGQDVKVWVAQLYPKYSWVSPPGRPAAGHIQLAIRQQKLQLSFCSQSWNLLNGIEAKNAFNIALFNICWTRAATFVDQRITGACISSGTEFCGSNFCHFCGYFYDPLYVNKYYQQEKLVFSRFKTSLRLF